MRKLIFVLPVAIFMTFFTSCGSQNETSTNVETNATTVVYENVNAVVFADLIKEKNTVLIDVRTAGEFAQGHIQGAKMITVTTGDFAKKINNLDKSKTYLVYCRSGNRSGKAMSKMKSAGFVNVYNLNGGIRAWGAAGMKLVK